MTVTGTPIKVLIAEDSPTARALLMHLIDSSPGMRVLAAVGDGEQAVEAAGRLHPDVVLMDVHMPRLDGFEAVRRIMQSQPVPIVMVSGTLTDQVAATFCAIDAGALAFLPHPPGPGHPDHAADAAELVNTVRLMSEVRVIRRWAKADRPPVIETPPARKGTRRVAAECELVAIGASTGGPPVLRAILSALPRNFPAPILVVQHIATGFVHGLAEWLASSCSLPIRVPAHGDRLMGGAVYLAPDGAHLGVDGSRCVMLSNAPPEHGLRPSVSFLFRSVAGVYGPRAVGVLLTGMGRDGAQELKLMRERGAVTIAQDEESSVIHGMPAEAIRLDAAHIVLSPDGIAAELAAAADAKPQT